MDLSKKVSISPNACKVAIYTDGIPTAAVVQSLSSFFNIAHMNATPSQVYITSGSLRVAEKSKTTKNGVVYDQKITFRLPTSDELRAQRIHEFQKIKFLEITLSNKAKLLFGRNDYFQNAAPVIETTSSEKITEVSLSQQSISPLGFLIQNTFIYQDEIIFIFQDGSEFIP